MYYHTGGYTECMPIYIYILWILEYGPCRVLNRHPTAYTATCGIQQTNGELAVAD